MGEENLSQGCEDPGKGVPGGGNGKCKGPEAGKRLTQKRRSKERGVPGVGEEGKGRERRQR
jgi:hypothetical protein